MIIEWTGVHVKMLRTAFRDTQQQFAERIGCSVAVVGKWESNGRNQTLLPKWAEAMDTAYKRLNLAQRERFAAALEASESGRYAECVDHPSDKDAATKRREFLAFTGLALAGVPRHVGTTELAARRAKFARLQDLDHHLGGGDTFRLYSVELAETEATLKNSTYSEAMRVNLTELVAEQAQQAGWAAFDAGHTGTAVGLFTYSHWAATEAGNTELAANALIHISYATGTAESVEAADAACRYLRGDTAAKAVAMLESRRAWSHALSRDTYHAERALDRAAAALARGDDGPHWCQWMDQTELGIMTGRVWTVLKRPDKAIEPFESAIAAYPDQWARDMALYTTWLAEAHLQDRNAARADELAQKALELASNTASVRPAKRVLELAGRLSEARTPNGTALRDKAMKIMPPVPVSL